MYWLASFLRTTAPHTRNHPAIHHRTAVDPSTRAFALAQDDKAEKREQKEMTLDFVLSFKVKGHFCSLLVSNIIDYLAFLWI